MKTTKKTSGKKPKRFEKVFDGKRQRVRGLWKRGDRYYVQMTLPRPDGNKKATRVALQAKTLTEARDAYRKLLVQRTEGTATHYANCPEFGEFSEMYISQIRGQKADGTVAIETSHLRFWITQFGQVRLNRITPACVRNGIAAMVALGKAQRTRNLAITVLRNVMNLAVQDNLIRQIPVTPGMSRKPRRKQRQLFTSEKLKQLCDAAMRVSPRGKQFCNFVTLLAYSGGRMSETLRLRWRDVDWRQQTLCFGSDGMAKGKEPRSVNFNPQLESHLKQMYENRKSEEWLFPSEVSGNEGAVKSFREILVKARKEAGQDGPLGQAVGFHDMRHMFCSFSLMSGVDPMSVAKWLGHRDKGQLVLETYGHLCDSHLQRAAQQVQFGSTVIDGGDAIRAVG